jgi:adenylate cyclase
VLAFPYGFLKEYDKAISEAEKAVSLDPNSAYAYLALGSALYCAERLQEAVTFLQKSLRLSPIPLTSNVLIVMGHCYRLLGQYEEAGATYKKVLQLYGPDHLIAHVSLAATYVLMGREKEARAEGAEVLRIDPNFSLERYAKMFPLKNKALRSIERRG